MIEQVGLRTIAARKPTAKKQQWLESRRGYLGATDISGIFGLNPYSSPHQVWLEKVKGVTNESNVAMRAGNHMEPFIAQEFQSIKGVKVRKSRLYVHEKFPFLACNPDREITYTFKDTKRQVHGLLECKRVGGWASRNFGDSGSDQIPPHYMVQVMWQLIITKKDFVTLCALIDDREIREYTYTFDPELFDPSTCTILDKADGIKLFNNAIAWWNKHVVEGVEPRVNGSEADKAWLGTQRESYQGYKSTIADDELEEEIARGKDLHNAIKTLETELEGVKNIVKDTMMRDESTHLTSSIGDFTWKYRSDGVAVFRTPFTTNKS